MLELLNNLESSIKNLFNVIPGYNIHKEHILDIIFKLKTFVNE